MVSICGRLKKYEVISIGLGFRMEILKGKQNVL